MRPLCGRNYAASYANCWNAVSPLASSCPFRIMCAVSIPANVTSAEWKALKPSIGRVIRLMKRWYCSMMLFRYLTCRILMVLPNPLNLRITLILCKPTRLAPLLSMKTRSGMLFVHIARLKKRQAAALSRRSDSMKPRGFPVLSTAR